MLDRLMCGRNSNSDVFSEIYTPNQAVGRLDLINPAGRELNVLLPPWHGGGSFTDYFASKITKAGNAVLDCHFHDDILGPDPEKVVASYDVIGRTVADKIVETVDLAASAGQRYESVNLVSMSLGNTALLAIASRYSNFDKVTMIVNASRLADSMWHGVRTQHLRSRMEAQGHSLQTLSEIWADLAPINHLNLLKDKQIVTYLSDTDSIIPTRYQEELVRAMLIAGLRPEVRTTRFGHYGAVGKFCLTQPERAPRPGHLQSNVQAGRKIVSNKLQLLYESATKKHVAERPTGPTPAILVYDYPEAV